MNNTHITVLKFGDILLFLKSCSFHQELNIVKQHYEILTHIKTTFLLEYLFSKCLNVSFVSQND